MASKTNNFKIKDGHLIKYTGRNEIIKIPDEVTVIDNEAFKENRYIKTVFAPKNLEEIGSYAFSSCPSLRAVFLNEGLKKIGSGAFSFSGIEEITLPDTVEELECNAFSHSRLKSIKLSKNLKTINALCFNNTSLTEITIPDNVTTIAGGAFASCMSLENIILPDTLQELGCKTDDIAWEGGIFANCIALTKIVIPENIKKIYANTFQNCNSLKEIVFKSSHLDYIGAGAFARCYSLPKIVFPTCNHISKDVLRDTYKITLIDEFDLLALPETLFYCDSKTLEKSPEFAKFYASRINKNASLDDLIATHNSLKNINNILLAENNNER